MRFAKVLPIVMVIVMLTGCMDNGNNNSSPGNTKNLSKYNTGPGDTKDLSKYNAGPVKIQSDTGSPAELTEGRHIVPVKQINNTPYASLKDVIEATGFRGEWLENGMFGIGDNDPDWTFKTGQSKATVAGEEVTMPAPAVKEGDQLYIPVSGLQALFGDVSVFTIETNNVAFFPKPAQADPEADDKNVDFADDPAADPAMAMDNVAININEAQMISYAKRYMGVKYDFGAAPYSRSRRFDCSTFTQHVFRKFGISLPRLSRQQATKGRYVSRTKLKRGDLMFFVVPGRFKSNRKVGHVGIYMGGGYMIHSSPKPKNGVQITPINKRYWKDTYLYAKRMT